MESSNAELLFFFKQDYVQRIDKMENWGKRFYKQIMEILELKGKLQLKQNIRWMSLIGDQHKERIGKCWETQKKLMLKENLT